MRLLNKDELVSDIDHIKKDIKAGKVFIYPTDTIYGIGCNALDDKAVKRIRDIKKRQDQPFSVIAPNKQWILENCELHKNNAHWLDKLPGPYTFIMELVNKKIISHFVNPKQDTVGVRIPHHWIAKLVEELGVPIVTTSVNKSGEQYMTSMEDIDPEIRNSVDYIFYEGQKLGKPSILVVFDKDNAEIKER